MTNLGPLPPDPLAHVADPTERLRLRRAHRKESTRAFLAEPERLGSLRPSDDAVAAVCAAARAALRFQRTLEHAFEAQIAERPADPRTVEVGIHMARTCEEAGRACEFLAMLERLPRPERTEIRHRLGGEILQRIARAARNQTP